MSVIAWIMLGLLAGIIAKAIDPGARGSGIIGTIILGIIGAYVGGSLVHWFNTGQFILTYSSLTLPGILVAAFGAIITIFIFRLLVGRTV